MDFELLGLAELKPVAQRWLLHHRGKDTQQLHKENVAFTNGEGNDSCANKIARSTALGRAFRLVGCRVPLGLGSG